MKFKNIIKIIKKYNPLSMLFLIFILYLLMKSFHCIETMQDSPEKKKKEATEILKKINTPLTAARISHINEMFDKDLNRQLWSAQDKKKLEEMKASDKYPANKEHIGLTIKDLVKEHYEIIKNLDSAKCNKHKKCFKDNMANPDARCCPSQNDYFNKCCDNIMYNQDFDINYRIPNIQFQTVFLEYFIPMMRYKYLMAPKLAGQKTQWWNIKFTDLLDEKSPDYFFALKAKTQEPPPKPAKVAAKPKAKQSTTTVKKIGSPPPTIVDVAKTIFTWASSFPAVQKVLSAKPN